MRKRATVRRVIKVRDSGCQDAIDAARTVALDRLIFSLGIRHVGEQTAKTLARAYGTWAAGHMKGLEPVATGIQLADENLGQRPARFLSAANMARFDVIRDHYDPDRRFAGWLSRPPADWGRA